MRTKNDTDILNSHKNFSSFSCFCLSLFIFGVSSYFFGTQNHTKKGIQKEIYSSYYHQFSCLILPLKTNNNIYFIKENPIQREKNT